MALKCQEEILPEIPEVTSKWVTNSKGGRTGETWCRVMGVLPGWEEEEVVETETISTHPVPILHMIMPGLRLKEAQKGWKLEKFCWTPQGSMGPRQGCSDGLNIKLRISQVLKAFPEMPLLYIHRCRKMHLEWFWCKFNRFNEKKNAGATFWFESWFELFCEPEKWKKCEAIIDRVAAQHLLIFWFLEFNKRIKKQMTMQRSKTAAGDCDENWFNVSFSNTFPIIWLIQGLSGIILLLAFFCFDRQFWISKLEITHYVILFPKRYRKNINCCNLFLRECCSYVYFIDSFCVNFKIQSYQE